MDLNELPSEITQKIFLFLTGDELAKFASTSKNSRSLINDDYIWKKICLREEITETRKIEISPVAIGLEKLCVWWTTYMESRLYYHFNWKYGRKKVKVFPRPYSDYFVAADETGLAIANESGTISVYDSYMTPLWHVTFIGEMDTLMKSLDTLCVAGENGITLIKKNKEINLEIWGDVHFLPISREVWILDDDEGNLAGWSLDNFELVGWSDYQSHLSQRIMSDDRHIYGLGQNWISCFNDKGIITSTINVDSSAVIRVNGNDDLVAALIKTDRYGIRVWSRLTSIVLENIEVNRPYNLKLSQTSNILAYCARDLDSNIVSTYRLGTTERYSAHLDFDNIANVQMYFLVKDILVLFIRMDWEPYTRMVVCDDTGNILHTSALRVKYILYADKRKVVLKCNNEIQIIYFDHRD